MFRIVSAAPLFALCLALPLRAAEVCVSCEEPAATYRCMLEQLPQSEAFALKDEAQAFVCEKVLAKSGPHAACHAVAETPCKGHERTVTLTDYQRAIAGDEEITYQPGVLELTQQKMQSAWVCVTSLFKDC